jgi:hypothetical protein
MAKQRKKKRPASRPQPARTAQPAHPAQPAAKRAPAAEPRAKPTRQERIEAAQRERRRRRLVRRGIWVAAAVVLAGVITSVVVLNRQASERTIRRLEAGACTFDRRSDEDAGQGRNHVQGTPAYEVEPPSGGNHLATPASPAIYTDRVPPDGQIVHSMEHGDIVLWHKPDVPSDVLDQLRGLANRYEDDVLVVPRGTLPTPVAATAWHRRLLCPNFEAGPIEQFIRAFRDKGPEKVEEG